LIMARTTYSFMTLPVSRIADKRLTLSITSIDAQSRRRPATGTMCSDAPLVGTTS
jgi:hypothetical protein